MVRRVRRYFPPLVVATLLACFGMTAWVAWGDTTFAEAGAVNALSLWRGGYGRLVTGIFLHMPWIHFWVNSLGIVLLGAAIARGLGRWPYLACVFAGSWAGFATSLLWLDGDPYRVGISAGLTAMLGVGVAVEWRNCDGKLGRFLRSRTMIVLLVIVALSAALTYWMRDRAGRPDHAAHVGGLVFGVLFGLFHFPRLRRDGSVTPVRPARGVIAVLIFAVAPAAYASYPVHDVDFCLFKARRAMEADEHADARKWYERAHDRDPDRLEPRVRLAVLKRDLSYLEEAEARLPFEQRMVVDAYLEVLRWKAVKGGPEVPLEMRRKMFELAQRSRWNPGQRWRLAFAVLAAIAERAATPDRTPAQQLAALQELVETATETMTIFASDQPGEAKTAMRGQLAGLLERTRGAAGTLASADAPPPGLPDLWAALARAYRRLANNPGETPLGQVAVWRYRLAECRRFAGGDAGAARPFMVAALEDARAGGNEAVAQAAAAWLDQHGFPVPAPDLAPPDEGR